VANSHPEVTFIQWTNLSKLISNFTRGLTPFENSKLVTGNDNKNSTNDGTYCGKLKSHGTRSIEQWRCHDLEWPTKVISATGNLSRQCVENYIMGWSCAYIAFETTEKGMRNLMLKTFYQTSSHKPHAGRRKGRKMPLMSMVTLTFKLVRARDQRRLPGEFGANPFIGSRDISYTNKKSLTAPKTEPYAVQRVR